MGTLFLGEGRILVVKNLRFRLTEAVDALLHITYHEIIIASKALLGYRMENGLLQIVTVLVLIHHDFFEEGRHLLGHRAKLMGGAIH